MDHTLTVFNAVDIPEDVAMAVMRLLDPFDPDCYTRACDATGKAVDWTAPRVAYFDAIAHGDATGKADA